MKYLYILLIIIFKNYTSLSAQNCGFIFKKDDKIESITEGYVQRAHHFASTRAVITIPVVVHVVWKNSVENISDAQIQSQIDVLNQDFRKLNTDFKDVPGSFKTVAADCEIEFCLASKDTTGKATTGIVRTSTTIDEIGSSFSSNKRRIYYNSLEGDNAWKPENYLNIWVCNMGNNVLGYTSPLKDAATKPQEDGVLVDYRAFGTIGTAASNSAHNKGRTATHEVGHYFNLLHIWGSDDTCSDDDLVNDTPLQATANRGCPSFPQLSCGVGSMYMNFMDYTDDNCMGLFTNGQKVRMLAALNEFRAGLLKGGFCEPTSIVHTPNELDWTIFPNPASDRISLRFSTPPPQYMKVEIRDLMGRVLKLKEIETLNTTSFEIPIEDLNTGLYILTLKIGNQLSVKKFLKDER